MNDLKRKEGDFLRLFLSTSENQRRAFIKTIQKTQLSAIVQIVYNVLMGTRELSEGDKTSLRKHKTIIRRFVSQKLSIKERKKLLLKYSSRFIKILNVVRKELN